MTDGRRGNDSTASLDSDRDASQPRVLVVIDGEAPRTYPLPDRGEIVVGRGDDAGIRIDSTSVSRRHACFSVPSAVT